MYPLTRFTQKRVFVKLDFHAKIKISIILVVPLTLVHGLYGGVADGELLHGQGSPQWSPGVSVAICQCHHLPSLTVASGGSSLSWRPQTLASDQPQSAEAVTVHSWINLVGPHGGWKVTQAVLALFE